MLEIGLFRNPRISAACLSVTLSFFALNGALFMLTLYLQQVRGLSPLGTGYRFIAIAAGVLLSSPIAARMTSGNFAGLAVASITLTRSRLRSLNPQAVWGSQV